MRRGLWIGACAVFAILLVISVPRGGWGVTSPSENPLAGGFPRAFHARKVAPVNGPNVLLISIDTLRADHMSLHGYFRATTPHIDAWAAKGRVFENACAAASFTAPSVASMLTGMYPYHHRVRLLWQKYPARVITVADYLRRAGYRTAGIVSNIVLAEQACGLGSRFDDYDERVTEAPSNRPFMLERRGVDTTNAALDWLARQRPSASPFLLWVHYMDPHGPYDAPPDAPRDFKHDTPIPVDPEKVGPSAREGDLADGAEYVDRYDEEIAYVDREIGRLLDAYAELGLMDNSVVVLTADHGEYLMDSQDHLFTHAVDVGQPVIHIPLVVWKPGLPAERVTQPVSLTDVMPTILDAVGLPLPDDLDGRSLLGTISNRPPYAEGPDSGGSGGLRRTFIFRDYKIVEQHGRSNIPRSSWAFDLLHDPHERNPQVVDPENPAAIVLGQLIRNDPDPGGRPENYIPGDKPQPLVAGGVDQETIRKLRSLGYVH